MTTVYLAADHAGFALKEALVPFLRDELGCTIEDCGAFARNPDDDYPALIASAAQRVSEDPTNRAIVLGKSGEGEAIVANRFPHVRAVVYYGGNPEIIVLSREHNDANVLSLGAGFLNEEDAKQAVREWLATPFSGAPRHEFRNRKIEEIGADACVQRHNDE